MGWMGNSGIGGARKAKPVEMGLHKCLHKWVHKCTDAKMMLHRRYIHDAHTR